VAFRLFKEQKAEFTRYHPKRNIMKVIKLMWMVVFCGLVAGQAMSQDKMSEVKIKTSAQCDMCKKRIEKALGLEKGIKSAVLDVDSKVLTVQYRTDKTDSRKVQQAVQSIGYDADALPADPKAYKKLPDCCQKGGHDH
jgi:copper chaperone CopZ